MVASTDAALDRQSAPLTLDQLKAAARDFARRQSAVHIPSLYGVADGKPVRTYVEQAFRQYLADTYGYVPDGASDGIDFPELGVDLKVAPVEQPHSFSAFRDATQKVYGLGHHLLLLAYAKTDDARARRARLTFPHVLFVAAERTADYQITAGILGILERQGNLDDLVAFLEERNLPLDEIGRLQLAERIYAQPPLLGVLTLSSALHWRLHYGRALGMADAGAADGVQELLASSP
jgi:hypothetical protein